MEPKKKLSVGGVTMELIAARDYSRNKSLFAGVNYKTVGVIFFPFFWFAFWCFEKVFKAKRLLTKIEKIRGKKMSKEQILVREFRTSDLESVKELINRTIDVCYNGYYCNEVMNYFDMYNWDGNILKIARDGYIVVVETQGKIVGTGSIIGEVVSRVFVDPGQQRQGLGKMIMNELEKRAVANGVKVVQLRALANARRFYESLRYVTVDKGLVAVDKGRCLEYYQMEKKLK